MSPARLLLHQIRYDLLAFLLTSSPIISGRELL